MKLAWIAAGLLLQAGAVSAQPQAPIWQGVYSTGQAARGEATFSSLCASCHGAALAGGPSGGLRAPALAGDDFFARWDATSLNRLFRTIRDSMPRGAAGSLNDEAAVELVAYVLRYNGFPAGSAELTAQPALLDTLLVAPKPGAPRPVTNFSRVDVTGCLSRTPNGRWVVTSASGERIRLVGAAPFKVDAHDGGRVDVAGLIRRDPAETLLTVTAVKATGTRCGT
jgi:mono/diheme cytochrome c family protein